ncbi:MAG: PqqD family protein, partial [Candidatus Omnitrophota bacterium]
YLKFVILRLASRRSRGLDRRIYKNFIVDNRSCAFAQDDRNRVLQQSHDNNCHNLDTSELNYRRIPINTNINLNTIFLPSEDVVAREIHGEFIIIPITSGIAESDDDIFSLNKTGRAIWKKMDGEKTLKNIVDILKAEFETSKEKISADCLGLSKELLKRKWKKLNLLVPMNLELN